MLRHRHRCSRWKCWAEHQRSYVCKIGGDAGIIVVGERPWENVGVLVVSWWCLVVGGLTGQAVWGSFID